MRLLESVRVLGPLLPLVVTEEAPGNYLVIDGARRYFCGKELGLQVLPCVVKPAMKEAAYQALRLELHHRVEPLNHQEYTDWLRGFEAAFGEGRE
jgi:ParB-like chromosome segregation protein Spo0J